MMHARFLLRTFFIGAFALVSFWDLRDALAQAKPATTGNTQLILIAVDGLSYDALQTAQRQGLLTSFKIGAHVSTFPSMSDVAWNAILRTTDVFGQPGRLKSAEAVYFDESTQSLEGDPRDYYRRQAHSNFYMNAFDHFLNPYIESLMYFPTEEVPKMEVKSIVDELLASPPKPVLTAFIAATDSMAHTQYQRLFPVIKIIDAELTRLTTGFRARGIEPRILLVSDHGNIGRFKEGEAEIELEKIDLRKNVEALGFRFVQKLEKSEDIAVPLLALGSWAPVYMKDRRRLPDLVRGLSQQPWFDLAAWIKSSSPTSLVMTVVSASGEADVIYDRAAKTYSYLPARGNPLQIEPVQGIDAAEAARLTVNTPYPDSLYRLVEAGLHKEFDYPDLILTSKDGTCFNNSLSSFTKMYRTHGALGRRSSLGIVASNFAEVPAFLRSKDILLHFGIDPRPLFGVDYRNLVMTRTERFAQVQQTLENGVPTEARDFSTKRVFRYITRFLADTRPYFVITELKSLFAAFSGNPFAQSTEGPPTGLRFDPSKLDYKGLLTPEDLGRLTDEVLRTPDPKALMNGPVLQGLKAKIEAQTGYGKNSGGAPQIPGPGGAGVTAKRAAMKLYQLPYLLDRSLSLPERTRVKDPRDLTFAHDWDRSRDALIKDTRSNLRAAATSARLFSEVHKETQLAERIFPAPLTTLYNRQLKDVTMVYVPGIYNSLFDNEIFSLGLLKMEEAYGLRVLKAPVESTCSTKYNGNLLMTFLKHDSATEVARGHAAPKYILISYSKGANDTLAGFVQDPNWVSKNVAGLLSIASPLHGSSILNRADLPFELVDALSANGGPEICRTTEPAGKSITPSAMSNFWRQNTRALVGLTRYYSLTFATEIENAHLFMKATKLLAQFDEDNDGVVTVSSSKFPEALGAIDFGTVDADHLSGVLSARFDQKAFFSAIVTALAEVGADDLQNNLRLNIARIVELANRDSKKTKITAQIQGEDVRIDQSTLWGLSNRALQHGVKSSYEWNQLLVPKIVDPAANYEPKTRLTDNNLKYDPYNLIDLRKLMSTDLAVARVKPMTSGDGIDMTFNHKNMVHFRMEHQFNYESSVQHNADDNPTDGFMPVERNGSPWVRMHSKGTSIRLTTMAYRFRPVDFPKTSLQMLVNTPVVGADVTKGGSGKDDSAFQVWFTIRIGNATNDRSSVDPKNDRIVTFGYYWGAKDSKKETAAGQLFENYYSNKSYAGLATLPEAWEVLLESPNKTGEELTLQRNLVEDLKRAFPSVRPEDMEVIAITLQHDSNDTRSESDVLFKSLKFTK